MLRPVSLLPALAVVASLAAWVGPVGPAAPAAAAAGPGPAEQPTPLAVSIETLTPSVIPASGRIRVTGTVTNRDDQTWTSISLFAFVSADPMTTAPELADATETEQGALVGDRITAQGTYDEVDELAPGESAQYSLRVPRSELEVDATGVYWFGVHALGSSEEGGDTLADGRARTFLPYVGRTRRSVDTALVIPVRHPVTHTRDGRVGRVASWTQALGTGGPLRSLVELGVSAGSRPVTWLVDPAVPDAVRHLVAGNRPRSLGPTVSASGDGDEGGGGDQGGSGAEDGGSDSPSPSSSAGDDASGSGEDTEEPSPAVQAAAAAGQTWLDRLHEGLEGSEVLTLPYGDLDVAAAAQHDPRLYRRARERSGDELQPWGLPTSPAVAPPGGYLDAAGIRQTEPSARILVSDRMFGADPPSVATTADRTLAVASSGVTTGGPDPDEPRSGLAVRQRILSEAALRLLAPGRRPLIVSLPQTWTPGPATGFFDGLDVDWLHLTPLSAAVDRRARRVPLGSLEYPDAQEVLELDAASFAAADQLANAGDVLQNLLTRNREVGSEVRDESLSDASYHARLRPDLARTSADRSRSWIESRLRSVRIEAPRAVILSSGSGRFQATITNTLDQPVTVKIGAVAGRPLKVSVPEESIDIGAERSTTILLNASSPGLGIRNVTLTLTDTDGVPLGSSDVVPIRSNRVSNVIWLILGTGIALLFGAIVVRLFRRVRAAARG